MTPPEYHYAIDPDAPHPPIRDADGWVALAGLLVFFVICVVFGYVGPVFWGWL